MQNISEYPGPILTYFTGLVGVLVGMIDYPNIRLVVVQGMLL